MVQNENQFRSMSSTVLYLLLKIFDLKTDTKA